jgi:demethylsterigmatocystin 6-O-methyltransferase
LTIGAKAYYLRNILHDWPDDRCPLTLSHIKAAMAQDSLLLIDEMVIPTKGAHEISMQVDMTMYGNFASEERTEKRWKELLDAAGFKIEKVYTYYQDELKDCIIVATPVRTTSEDFNVLQQPKTSFCARGRANL